MMKKLFNKLVVSALLICGLGFSAAESESAKLVALTFDDGPGEYTAGLLDALAERQAHATFFVVGRNAAAYPELLQRYVAEGHQLANHTYSHPDLANLSSGGVSSELQSTQNLISEAGGAENAMVRPPYGSYGYHVCDAAGVPLILWSVDPQDWLYRDAERVCNHIVGHAYDGAIILVHDIHPTSVRGAIMAVDILQKEGYEFLTVEELFAERGLYPAAGGVYTQAPYTGAEPYLLASRNPEAFNERMLKSHPGYYALQTAFARGWMSKAEDGKWLPNKYVDRTELIATLEKFNPIKVAVKAKKAEKVKKGKEQVKTAEPLVKEEITREQAAVIFKEYLKLVPIENAAGINIKDAEKIAPATKDSVMLCLQHDIMRCRKGSFRPADRLTRADLACALVVADFLRGEKQHAVSNTKSKLGKR